MGTKLDRTAKAWRRLAEEARTVADAMVCLETQRIMRGIAASYDRLADWVESNSARLPPTNGE